MSRVSKVLKILPVLTVMLIVLLVVLIWRKGVFESADALEDFVMQFGAAAGIVFVFIQILQVIVPVIPGGITCAAGVVLFGPVGGFLFNYIGICTGSIAAFLISKRYGKKLLEKMFSPKRIAKYDHWTEKNNRFAKLFALTIALPFFPDDFLCYLAGTTRMRFQVFLGITLIARIPSLLAYSLGVTAITDFVLRLW